MEWSLCSRLLLFKGAVPMRSAEVGKPGCFIPLS